MVLIKTQAGQEALKNRHGSLSSRQRSAFILFDGKRSIDEVLGATVAMGITQGDVQAMMDAGLLVPLPEQQPAAVPATAPPEQDPGRSPQQRYQAAYPIAAELTARLGLRGFRLNLAVEGARSFDALAALAPKIRGAVGAAPHERLDRALFDRPSAGFSANPGQGAPPRRRAGHGPGLAKPPATCRRRRRRAGAGGVSHQPASTFLAWLATQRVAKACTSFSRLSRSAPEGVMV